MDKLYQRINYENSPSKKTPLSEANLNKMDKALDDLDNRIIEQDAAFAKSIEEEGKKIEEVNGKVSDLTGTVATLTQSKADAIVCSASGERITATDSADAGFEQFRTFGWGKQEKTSGKNLAKSVYVSTALSLYGVALYVEADLEPSTTYTIRFEGAVGNVYYANENICNLVGNHVIGSGITSLTFTTLSTLDSTVNNQYVDGYGWSILKNSVTQSTANVFDNLMLNEGEVSLPYEPYTGGIPSPNPEYPQPIVSAGQKLENGIVSDVGISKKLTGKNLLKNTATSLTVSGVTFTVNEDGTITANGTATVRAQIRVGNVNLTAGTYIVSQGFKSSKDSTGAVSFASYTINGTTTFIDLAADDQCQFTIDTNVKVGFTAEVRTAGQTVSNLVFKPMIRYASITDDTYEPYTEQTITLNRVLRGIPLGTSVPEMFKSNALHMAGIYWDEKEQQYYIADTIDAERGVLVQRVGELNPRDYTIYGWGTEQVDGVTVRDYYIRVYAYNGSIRLPVMCNKFVDYYKYDVVQLNGVRFSHNNAWGDDYLRVMFRVPEEISTTELLKEYIGEDCTLIYPLATPIETPLTDEEILAYKALHSNKPTTVITNDAGCYMEVEYVADTKNHIAQNYVPVSKYTALEERVSVLEQLHV